MENKKQISQFLAYISHTSENFDVYGRIASKVASDPSEKNSAAKRYPYNF